MDGKAYERLWTQVAGMPPTQLDDGLWNFHTTHQQLMFQFLHGGGKYRVSKDGGSHPVWRADGKGVVLPRRGSRAADCRCYLDGHDPEITQRVVLFELYALCLPAPISATIPKFLNWLKLQK
jgi:hypothetical protein